ncbi:hypothetical protein [Flavobacterium cutihirudinis]|nr:hypothetical protein [Flavobacterium cutihirudinis]
MKNKLVFLTFLLFFGTAIGSLSAFSAKETIMSSTENNFKGQLKVLSLNT